MDVELITIGDELLLGFTIDTNAAHLARELASIGIGIRRRATVGDVAVDIVSVVREAIDRTGAVITTGGLGPTSDDLTKPAIASLFGRRMQLDDAHLTWMEQRWQQRFHRRMPESNRAQAMLPEGATKLVNQHGSAPGIWLEDLFVRPAYRRLGIGGALLDELRRRTTGRVEWSVLDWNQPAIDFYHRAGATMMNDWRICRVAGDALHKMGTPHA